MLWAFVACVLSNWWNCFLNLQVFFSIYLVVLWAFVVRVLSNWWSCFLNLQVFFSIYLVVLWAFVVRVLSNWWSCFLNLLVFFFYLQCVSLFGCVVSIAARVLSNWWSCFLNCQVFFFYLQRIELSQPLYYISFSKIGQFWFICCLMFDDHDILHMHLLTYAIACFCFFFAVFWSRHSVLVQKMWNSTSNRITVKTRKARKICQCWGKS